jgi:proline racemase
MQERRLYFEEHLDDLRLLLMREPRGHSATSGAFLQPPTRSDAESGVLFVEVPGLLPMCGHATRSGWRRSQTPSPNPGG